MIVLDLYAEVKPVWINSDQFYGVPYIWKVLFLFLSTPLLLSSNFPCNETRVILFQVHAS
jgi:hypothetical protein